MCAHVFVLPFALSAGILGHDWAQTDFDPEVQHLCLPGVVSSCVPARTSRADCGRTLTCRHSPDSLTQNSTRGEQQTASKRLDPSPSRGERNVILLSMNNPRYETAFSYLSNDCYSLRCFNICGGNNVLVQTNALAYGRKFRLLKLSANAFVSSLYVDRYGSMLERFSGYQRAGRNSTRLEFCSLSIKRVSFIR